AGKSGKSIAPARGAATNGSGKSIAPEANGKGTARNSQALAAAPAKAAKGQSMAPEKSAPSKAESLRPPTLHIPPSAYDSVPPGKRKEVQRLLEVGATRGYLTYDEVNDALTPEMVTSEQIDDLMVLFGQNSIEVVVAASQASRNDRQPPPTRPRESEPPPRSSEYPSVPPSALEEGEISKSS